MRFRNGKRALFGMAGITMMALISLTGCARVEIVDSMPASRTTELFSSRMVTGDGTHNLAVAAVDFDPPLNYQQVIIQGRSVALLVAVENSGSHIERDVPVRLHLTSPDQEGLLQTREANMAYIAPGEVRVVRFAHLGEIPHHQTYHLEVMVEPVAGESYFSDNLRAFDIQIYQGLSES